MSKFMPPQASVGLHAIYLQIYPSYFWISFSVIPKEITDMVYISQVIFYEKVMCANNIIRKVHIFHGNQFILMVEDVCLLQVIRVTNRFTYCTQWSPAHTLSSLLTNAAGLLTIYPPCHLFPASQLWTIHKYLSVCVW